MAHINSHIKLFGFDFYLPTTNANDWLIDGIEYWPNEHTKI